MDELTEEEIQYLNQLGFEPIIKAKGSADNQTFITGGNNGQNSNNTN